MLADLQPPKSRAMTREEALRRGQALAVELENYVEAAETQRRMPEGAVQAVRDSGLMPIVRPALYGGYELDWMTVVDIVSEISRRSCSLGWCTSFLFQHQWMMSYFPKAGQDYVYGRDPDPAVVTSFAPTGVATKVDGGYRVNGTWHFGSGGDHCSWAVVGCRLAEPDPALPRGLWVLLKTEQFRMKDVWNSVGLKGSGSNDIVVDGAFVADGFWLDTAACAIGRGESAKFLTGNSYRTGTGAQFQFALIGPLLGAVQGLFDSFVASNRQKMSAIGAGKVADNPLLQVKVGECWSEIESARAIIERLSRKAYAGEMTAPEAAGEFVRGVGVAARLLLTCADRLYNASGARGLTEGSPMARHWRDVHAITNHIGFQPELVFLPSGREALGAG